MGEVSRGKLIEVLAGVVGQGCCLADGSLDSCALSAYADGMRVLAVEGKLVIDREHGRRVIGHWVR